MWPDLGLNLCFRSAKPAIKRPGDSSIVLIITIHFAKTQTYGQKTGEIDLM
jgi:hypothetical protein